MATVFDTARYILECLGDISAMKLQRLCYYAQAWSMVWDDRPLFDEDFEAWSYGPVIRKLYYQTKGQFLVTVADEPGDSANLSENQKNSINKVLEYYGDKNAQWLSELTHLEDPWKFAKRDSVISKATIAEYYGSL